MIRRVTGALMGVALAYGFTAPASAQAPARLPSIAGLWTLIFSTVIPGTIGAAG